MLGMSLAVGGAAAPAAAASASDPFGNAFDRLDAGDGAIRIMGWGIDRNTSRPISVRVSIDGAPHTVTADLKRVDVERAFPGYGPFHGFDVSLPASRGAHEVCVTFLNVGPGSDRAMGCRSARSGGSPFGNPFERLVGVEGGIRAKSWAIDPDTSNPVQVRYAIDGAVQTVTANAPRADVEAAFPGYGPNHGFEGTLTASPGTHEVCVTFVDVGVGSDKFGGCRTVQVDGGGGSPFGNPFERLQGVEGGIRAKSWAIDPDTSNPVQVRYAIDGAVQTVTANAPRADVEAAFPGYGPNHGFEGTLTASPGSHEVCVTFVDVGVGSDKFGGCRTVSVPVGQVFGGTTSGRPDASSTGVPSGTSLQVHYGDLRIKTPGTVINGLDIRGYVQIEADNVTIRNSIIRGGAAATTDRALVASWWGARNFVIEDSTIVAANPSLRIDGVSGSNFTARRLNIYGVVDPIKILGSNVTVTDSWLHDTIHSENDPNQSDGRTHDDSIQIAGGSNILLRNNVMEDAHNAAIMLSQGTEAASSVRIENNWLQDGVCTVNVSTSGPGGGGNPIQGMKITGNRFGPSSVGTGCPMRLPSNSPIQVTANTWDTNNTTAKPLWF